MRLLAYVFYALNHELLAHYDVSAVFDIVELALLLERLPNSLGATDSVLLWLRSLLTDRFLLFLGPHAHSGPIFTMVISRVLFLLCFSIYNCIKRIWLGFSFPWVLRPINMPMTHKPSTIASILGRPFGRTDSAGHLGSRLLDVHKSASP